MLPFQLRWFPITIAAAVALSTTVDAADCRAETPAPGQGCWDFANAYGITQAQLEAYNPTLQCPNIQAIRYCVTPGTLPKIPPPPANPDGTCRYHDVRPSGDDCSSIAKLYGITVDQFYELNPQIQTDCKNLKEDMRVCVSAGVRPLRTPQPYQNGTCFTFKIEPGDNNWSCARVAAKFDLTIEQIDQYNLQTRLWKPCPNLQSNVKFCLSPGNPPRPDIDPRGFCDAEAECQKDCGYGPDPPTGCSAGGYRAGYYASWVWQSKGPNCPAIRPSNLITSAYNYLLFSFAEIDENGGLTYADPHDVPLMHEFNALKAGQPGLRTAIAVGGWAFNDENDRKTCWRFGNMVRTPQSRRAFLDSAIAFMRQYGFDGLDIDWEYPGAGDRCGSTDDRDNLSKFLDEAKARFNSEPERFVLTITLPASFWYLQHFDIARIAQAVDYINMMTYDIHGQWDAKIIPWLGPKVNHHTSITEIEQGVRIISKAGGNEALRKTALGVGFYARSFRLADPSCTAPGCPFTSEMTADPGECTKNGGTLAYYEIQKIMDRDRITPTYYDGGAYFVYNGNQWVGFDDLKSLESKKALANKYCMAGLFVWAVDNDTPDRPATALSNALGPVTGVLPGVSNSATYIKSVPTGDGSKYLQMQVFANGESGPNMPLVILWDQPLSVSGCAVPDENGGRAQATLSCTGGGACPSLLAGIRPQAVVRLPDSCAGGRFVRALSASPAGGGITLEYDFGFKDIAADAFGGSKVTFVSVLAQVDNPRFDPNPNQKNPGGPGTPGAIDMNQASVLFRKRSPIVIANTTDVSKYLAKRDFFDWIGGVGQTIADGFKQVGEGIGDFFDGVGDVFTGNPEGGFEKMWNSVGKVGHGVATLSPINVVTGGGLMTDVVDPLLGFISPFLPLNPFLPPSIPKPKPPTPPPAPRCANTNPVAGVSLGFMSLPSIVTDADSQSITSLEDLISKLKGIQATRGAAPGETQKSFDRPIASYYGPYSQTILDANAKCDRGKFHFDSTLQVTTSATFGYTMEAGGVIWFQAGSRDPKVLTWGALQAWAELRLDIIAVAQANFNREFNLVSKSFPVSVEGIAGAEFSIALDARFTMDFDARAQFSVVARASTVPAALLYESDCNTLTKFAGRSSDAFPGLIPSVQVEDNFEMHASAGFTLTPKLGISLFVIGISEKVSVAHVKVDFDVPATVTANLDVDNNFSPCVSVTGDLAIKGDCEATLVGFTVFNPPPAILYNVPQWTIYEECWPGLRKRGLNQSFLPPLKGITRRSKYTRRPLLSKRGNQTPNSLQCKSGALFCPTWDMCPKKADGGEEDDTCPFVPVIRPQKVKNDPASPNLGNSPLKKRSMEFDEMLDLVLYPAGVDNQTVQDSPIQLIVPPVEVDSKPEVPAAALPPAGSNMVTWNNTMLPPMPPASPLRRRTIANPHIFMHNMRTLGTWPTCQGFQRIPAFNTIYSNYRQANGPVDIAAFTELYRPLNSEGDLDMVKVMAHFDAVDSFATSLGIPGQHYLFGAFTGTTGVKFSFREFAIFAASKDVVQSWGHGCPADAQGGGEHPMDPQKVQTGDNNGYKYFIGSDPHQADFRCILWIKAQLGANTYGIGTVHNLVEFRNNGMGDSVSNFMLAIPGMMRANGLDIIGGDFNIREICVNQADPVLYNGRRNDLYLLCPPVQQANPTAVIQGTHYSTLGGYTVLDYYFAKGPM
ncbi:hypothetical protein HK104_000277, partial [Borealophlyctis nickersoniae]